MTSQRPHLECPKCGSYDIVPLVAVRDSYFWPPVTFHGGEMSPFVRVGLPRPFPFRGPFGGFINYVDLLRQGYIAEFRWDETSERPSWSCKKCRHAIVTFGSENEKLLAQAWAYIEATFVPTPDEVKDKSRRIRSFQNFLDEVVPQAVRAQATAIRLNDSAFLIEGKWVQTAHFRRLHELLGAIRFGHLPGDMKFAEGQSVNVRTHKDLYRVTLRPTSLVASSIELELLDHNYPEEFLREITPRERKALCPSCGEVLRTKRAQQCFACGLDWHESANADKC